MSNDLGNKIKSLRIARNLTQQELADEMGVARQMVSRWENGERNIYAKQLVEIAKVLNVTLDYFSTKSEDQQLFETLTELSNFFSSEGIPEEDKDKAYQSIMMFYLKSKEKGRENTNGNKDTSNADGGSASISEQLKQ